MSGFGWYQPWLSDIQADEELGCTPKAVAAVLAVHERDGVVKRTLAFIGRRCTREPKTVGAALGELELAGFCVRRRSRNFLTVELIPRSGIESRHHDRLDTSPRPSRYVTTTDIAVSTQLSLESPVVPGVADGAIANGEGSLSRIEGGGQGDPLFSDRPLLAVVDTRRELARRVLAILEGGVRACTDGWPMPKLVDVAKAIAEVDIDDTTIEAAAWDTRQIVQSQNRAPAVVSLLRTRLAAAVSERDQVRAAIVDSLNSVAK